METFCLPLHEIRERFTKSETFIMAWRSQEQNHSLKVRLGKTTKDTTPSSVGRKRRYGPNEFVPEGLPDHFFNEDGEVDLSRVTSKDALRYMSALGIPFPVMNTGRKNPSFGGG